MDMDMEADRNFSELPEDIIQHIQSFMYIKQGTRSTLLSKSWLRAWSTRPFLDFDYNHFGYDQTMDHTLDNLVDATLQSYLHHGLPILKFRLQTLYIQQRWLDLVVQNQNNLIELDLYSRYNNLELEPSVWRDIFSKKSLELLRFDFARGPIDFHLVLRHTDIKCVNLKKLYLRSFHIDEITFQHITRRCPLIEELLLEACTILFNFRAADLPNLRFLKLVGNMKMESIDLCNAPRLQSFYFEGALVFDIGECASLKRLVLRCADINNEQLQTILSKNPQVEDLTLIHSNKLIKQINLSSLSLRRLEHFHGDRNHQVQLIIDAPNLHTLRYFCLCTTPFPITSPATKGEVNVRIDYRDRKINASWFSGLRKFLSRFTKSTVQFTCTGLRFTSEMLRAIPLRHKVQALTIQGNKLSANLLLLYAYFSICHPRTVLLRYSDFSDCLPSLKKLCEALCYRGDLECCKFDQIKCWRHYVKDAKIYYVVNKEQKPFEINGLGMAMESAEWMHICFTGDVNISLALEWECSD